MHKMTVDVVKRAAFFTFLVSIHFRRGWLYTMLLCRRHEILHFDITKLISVSTE